MARTPEELEAWISQAPDLREPLEDAGCTPEFTAGDLFPLYEVMVEKAGGPPRVDAAAPPSTWWGVGKLAAIALAIAVIVVVLVLAVT